MTTKLLTFEQSRPFAEKFFSLLDKSMKSDLAGPQQLVLLAMDALYEMFTTTEASAGWAVRNIPENGGDVDLFNGTPKELWDAVLYDNTHTTISFFDTEASRETFLVVLASQVLANVPSTPEEARLHVKRQVVSLFNGMNQYHLRFELVYIDYNMVEGEFYETQDLAELLVA